jgi:hypothetical protein
MTRMPRVASCDPAVIGMSSAAGRARDTGVYVPVAAGSKVPRLEPGTPDYLTGCSERPAAESFMEDKAWLYATWQRSRETIDGVFSC